MQTKTGAPRSVKIHELKIKPEYFMEVWAGRKRFEIRKDDRDYRVGDLLLLKEWDGERFTGLRLLYKVTFLLRDCPELGLSPGYCIMSIRRLPKKRFSS